MIYKSLNPEKALIWRIIHRDNLSWLLENGLHCASSDKRSLDWVTIGNKEIIQKREKRFVPISPYGKLNDYIPFYFTQSSIMLYNITTGYGGIEQRSKEEILILASSLFKIKALGLNFIFTDKHAYIKWACFYSDLKDLCQIDWDILQRRDFKRDTDDSAKIERYQAEALIHQYCPIQALLGIACYSESQALKTREIIKQHGLNLLVYVRPEWYL